MQLKHKQPVCLKISLFLITSLAFLFGFSFSVQAQSNQIVLNGNFTGPAVFQTGGCGYTWTNTAPEIGLPASGAGDIASFKAINTGTAPIIATIIATPVSAALAYVANSGSNDVSVVSTGTKTVIATIPVGANPFGAAVSPDGRTVYITNKDDASVSVIDVYSNTVTATITVEAGPLGIAVSPDGKYVYVACGAANAVSVIDVTAKTVITNISVGQNPYGVAVNPNGTRVYVSNYNGRSVTVINTTSYGIVATIGTGNNPAGIVISPDGNTAYVATAGANKLTVIDASSNTVTKQITVNENPVAIAINDSGNELYLIGIFGFMNIVDPVTNFVIGTASPGAQGIAFTPDHSAFYYTDRVNNRLSYTAANLASGGIISPLGNGPTSFGNFIAPGPPCNSPVVKFTIQVNPSPNIQATVVTGTIATCVGIASSGDDIEQFVVSGNALSGDINIVAPANFEISLNANSGYSNSISLAAVAGTVGKTIIFVRSISTAPAGLLTGSINCSSSGAADKQVTVTATINQTPAVNTVDNQTISAGVKTTAINFNGTATMYKWVNDAPGIGLATSGNGPVSSFTAVNNTDKPITANITVTPYSETCTGTSTTFSITVNPAPVITANASLTAVSIEYGAPSPSNNFSVSGTNLSAGITVTAPAGFEVSNDGVNYNVTTIAGSAGNITNATIYFRLKAGSAANTYSGNITLSSPGATNVNVDLPDVTITPAPLTITADDITKTYGETLQNILNSDAYKITAGSLKNGNTISDVEINYGTGSAAKDVVGSYPTAAPIITAGGNGFLASNYIINLINGNLTVSPAPLTITAEDKMKIYGSINPALTVVYNGFVNNEDAGILTVKPAITTTATTTSVVGIYPITVTGAVMANYTITYVDGTLTIVPKPVSINPPNAFTPNGDGVNDFWEVSGLTAYPDCTVKIYSRWGNLIFQSKGYLKPWDGKFNNTLLPFGTYYYVIDLGDQKKPLSGNLTIIR